MKSNIPEEIHISPCGTFCLPECQFLVDPGPHKAYRCKLFNEVLGDDPYGSRPIRCTKCGNKLHGGSTWEFEGL